MAKITRTIHVVDPDLGSKARFMTECFSKNGFVGEAEASFLRANIVAIEMYHPSIAVSVKKILVQTESAAKEAKTKKALQDLLVEKKTEVAKLAASKALTEQIRRLMPPDKPVRLGVTSFRIKLR